MGDRGNEITPRILQFLHKCSESKDSVLTSFQVWSKKLPIFWIFGILGFRHFQLWRENHPILPFPKLSILDFCYSQLWSDNVRNPWIPPLPALTRKSSDSSISQIVNSGFLLLPALIRQCSESLDSATSSFDAKIIRVLGFRCFQFRPENFRNFFQSLF